MNESPPVADRPQVQHLTAGLSDEHPGYHIRRPRGSGDWLVMLTLAGSGRIALPEGELITALHDLVVLHRGTPHDYSLAPGASHWRILWTHFQPRPHWLAWLDWPQVAPGVGHIPLAPGNIRAAVRRHFFNTHQLAISPIPDAALLAMAAFEQALIFARQCNPRTDAHQLDDRIHRAIVYLGDHMADPLTVDDLALAASLSPSRFAHLFREQTHLTPMQFLERHRLNRAKQLLEATPTPIGLIARTVGFTDPFHFSKRFKTYTCLSPRAYRRQYRK